MALVARLLQSVPLVIALVVLAIVVYVFVAWVKSPLRAKEILIKLFTVITDRAFGCFWLGLTLRILRAQCESARDHRHVLGRFARSAWYHAHLSLALREAPPAVQEQGHAHEISLEVSNDRLVCHFSSARNWMFMSTLPSMPETEPVLEYCQMLKYWLNVGAFTLYCASQML